MGRDWLASPRYARPEPRLNLDGWILGKARKNRDQASGQDLAWLLAPI